MCRSQFTKVRDKANVLIGGEELLREKNDTTLEPHGSDRSDGLFVEYGLVDAVLDDPQHDYTKKLLVDTPTLELAHLR